MARYICGDCWQYENPDSYKPDGEDDMGECDACDATGLLYRDDVDAFIPATCEGMALGEDAHLEEAYEDRFIDPDLTDLPDFADSAEEFFA